MRALANLHKELRAPLRLDAWDQQDCQGNMGLTIFDNQVLARNISNYQVSRSFKLNRTLEGQEQLHISVTNVSIHGILTTINCLPIVHHAPTFGKVIMLSTAA